MQLIRLLPPSSNSDWQLTCATRKILPRNIHDIHSAFCFRDLGHERRTFPHVHDIHDVQPESSLSCSKEFPQAVKPIRSGTTGVASPKTGLYSIVKDPIPFHPNDRKNGARWGPRKSHCRLGGWTSHLKRGCNSLILRIWHTLQAKSALAQHLLSS